MLRRGGLGSSRALPILLLASLLGLLAMDLDRRRTVIDELDAVRRLGEIHADAAVAHLWVEEWLSGDEVDVAALEERLNRLRTGTEALIAGRWARAQPQHDEQLRRLRRDVAQFQQITEDRLEGRRKGLQVGIGSPFDVEYDRVFQLVLDRVAQLEQSFEAQRSWAERRHSRWFRSLLGLCALVVLATFWLVLRRERERLRERRLAEHELAEKEQHVLRLQKIEVLGRLAGGLAHDINNYLAAIRSQCELLRIELEDLPGPTETHRSRLDAVLGTSARAGALIDRLLAFGSRKAQISEVIDPRELLEHMEPMLRATAPDGVRIEIQCPAEVWQLEAESVSLEQAVFNLVLNALDAVEGQGRVVIEVGCRSEALSTPEGEKVDAVEIQVIDDGRGIDSQDLGNIFEPFWSSKTWSSKAGEGDGEDGGHAGLGLAIVQSAVARAGGEISVQSEAGAGTMFSMLLPRAAEPGPSVAGGAASSSRSTPGLESLGGTERVLLVDDHEELREATAMLLETVGYEAHTAADLNQARKKIGDGTFDAIIVDLNLPDGNGLRFIEALRREGIDWPVVAYSGRASDEHLARCRELGIPWVAKNSSTGDLLVALRRVLEGGVEGAGNPPTRSSSVHEGFVSLDPER